MQARNSPRRITFGLFEADLQACELRKNGMKIRLRGQPFDILAMLLERPGEVVTREELQQRLWPDGTFVDFDHSLNTAVNKIREALDDSAENPRFVETIPRRGYRFIAPVQSLTKGSEKPLNPFHPSGSITEDIGDGVAQSTLDRDLDGHPPAPTSHAPFKVKLAAGTSRPWLNAHRWLVAFTAMTGLMAAALIFWRITGPPHPVVLGHSQITNDSWTKYYQNNMATDGPRIYFTEMMENHYQTVQVSSTGGEFPVSPQMGVTSPQT